MTEQEQLAGAVCLIIFAASRLVDIHYTEKLKAQRDVEKNLPPSQPTARGKVSVHIVISCALIAICCIPLLYVPFYWLLEKMVFLSRATSCSTLAETPVAELGLLDFLGFREFLCFIVAYFSGGLAVISSTMVYRFLYDLAAKISAPNDGEFHA